MPFSSGRNMPFSRLLKATFALAGGLALLLGGCRSGVTDGNAPEDGQSTLAVGLATPPAQFSDVVVGQGYNTPMSIAFDPDGRLYVVEKGGTIKMVGQSTPVLLPSQLPGLNQTGERGLLSVAFDPAWANPAERWMYVHWSHTSNNKISRILISTSAPYVATGALQDVYNLSPLSSTSFAHNGGPMYFAADGTLFISTGDNGVGANAQNTGNLIGKLLRINKDGTIPAGNPFGNAIWAYGLRNPYTFAIQPGTGRIFINDIGQDAFEEVNETSTSAGGQNFGWPISEGPTTIPGHTNPRISYVNGAGAWGDDCAVAGAAFYNPPGAPAFPAPYVGDYFYADMCSGYIKGYDLATSTSYTFATGVEMISDLRLGPDGALYYLIYRVTSPSGDLPGYVGRIAYTGTNAPSISRQPASATLPVGGSHTFTVEAVGGGLSYQWQRNGSNIPGATSASYTLSNVQAADNNAQFRCVVTNSFGSATSEAAVLTITSNRAPTAIITSPANNTLYTAGESFSFTGLGTDPEQGELPASAYSWRVDFHHDTHNHPHVAPYSGATGGSFSIPTTGEISDNVWYRISLTVTDAGGLSHTAICDVVPRKATITITSNPAGLTVTLDGAPRVTPFTFVGVAGLSRPLGLTSPQTLNGQTYTFASWSDGGAQNHIISTPATNTTYIANFSGGGSDWFDADIGAVGQPGSSTVSGTAATVRGSGADIWGPADGFHFTYKPLSGDGTLTARITGVEATDPWAKAGVMIRENTAAESRHTFMALTSANGLGFQRRDVPGGETFHTGAAGGAPVWVRLVRTGNNIKGFQSADGVNWNLVGEINQALPANVLAGLAVTSHNNGALNASTFDNISLSTAPPPPPATWTAQDIGNVGLGGSTTETNGSYTVKGAGEDIYNGADGFHFYHRALIGDGSITARVASISNTHEWAKAGIMIRETTASGSRHVYVGTTPANGLEFLRREGEGAGTIPVPASGAAPRWFRATRVGDVLTVFHSPDGVAWTQVGQVAMPLTANIRMGLAVASHNPAVLNTAVFDNVTVVE